MKSILSIILFVVACFLLALVMLTSYLFILIQVVITWTAPKFFLDMALAIDRLGNVLIAPVANKLMIEKKGYQFGKGKETISSVLGKNKAKDTLILPGKMLCATLDFLDPNHCINSIDYNV